MCCSPSILILLWDQTFAEDFRRDREKSLSSVHFKIKSRRTRWWRQPAKADASLWAHACARDVIGELYDTELASKARIQYGESVKPDNARALLTQPDIDGALMGGASMEPRSFARIVRAGQRD